MRVWRIFLWSFAIVAVLVLSNGVYPWAWLLLMRNGGPSSGDERDQASPWSHPLPI
jgi:hypothetical protein